MTTSEQLELAAKAMGLVIDEHRVPGGAWVYPKGAPLNRDGEQGGLIVWNPLTDQAESDRMACALELNTLWQNAYVIVRSVDDIEERVPPLSTSHD
jgi:hypothetical protein